MTHIRRCKGPTRAARVVLVLGVLLIGGASFTWVVASTMEAYTVQKNQIETADAPPIALGGESKTSWMF